MSYLGRGGWPVSSSLSGAPSVASLTVVPTWIKVGNAISHTAFQTAALTNTITLFSLIAGGVIGGIKIKHATAFGGGAIATYTVSVGIAGDNARYATAFNVFQAVANGTMQTSNGLWSENNGAATTVQITATSTGANLSASTAGVVNVWALLSLAV